MCKGTNVCSDSDRVGGCRMLVCILAIILHVALQDSDKFLRQTRPIASRRRLRHPSRPCRKLLLQKSTGWPNKARQVVTCI